MFRRIQPQLVVDNEDGVIWTNYNRFAKEYTDAHGRRLLVPCERGPGGNILYISSTLQWAPPHAQDRIVEAERRKILEQIRKGELALGCESVLVDVLTGSTL